jgi:hypothetical protein
VKIPTNGGYPIVMVELACPPAICRATDSAVLMGMASPAEACWLFPSLPAVLVDLGGK